MKSLQSKLYSYFWAAPVLFVLITVFFLRGKVQYVYLGVAILVLLTVLAQRYKTVKPELTIARWLATLSSIGLSAAVILSIEKIELLKEPAHVASCSLSPIVACSPIIASPQASAFGFPNSFIGVAGYGGILLAALTIAAGGTKLASAWWRMMAGGLALATTFAGWLFYQGVFNIGKLCLYCMLVWFVTSAMLWLVVAYCIEKKHLNLGKKLNKLLGYKYEAITLTFGLILVLLFYRWSDYWLSLF